MAIPRDRRIRIEKSLRLLAGILTILTLALVSYAWWYGFGLFCGATIVAAMALGWRALGIRRWLPYRLPWIGAVAIFALWTAVILFNQFHGLPPPSDRYIIAGCGLAFGISTVGLILDSEPSN